MHLVIRCLFQRNNPLSLSDAKVNWIIVVVLLELLCVGTVHLKIDCLYRMEVLIVLLQFIQSEIKNKGDKRRSPLLVDFPILMLLLSLKI